MTRRAWKAWIDQDTELRLLINEDGEPLLLHADGTIITLVEMTQ